MLINLSLNYGGDMPREWNCILDTRAHSQMRFICIFNPIGFKHIVAYWRHVSTWNWVNIGSGNGLMPDGTKPLPEPMLTYHQ